MDQQMCPRENKGVSQFVRGYYHNIIGITLPHVTVLDSDDHLELCAWGPCIVKHVIIIVRHTVLPILISPEAWAVAQIQIVPRNYGTIDIYK